MDELQRKDDALFDALNKSKKKKRIRRLITVLVIVGVVVLALVLLVNNLRRRVEASMAVEGDEVKTYAAAYGSISTRVSGSGIIEDVDTEVITVPDGVEVEEVLVRSNAKLQEGDVIATLDLTTVLSAMATVQEEIDALDEDLQAAAGDRATAAVVAGAEGRIKRIFVKTGDDVAACMVEHGALALVSLDGKMAVDFENAGLTGGTAVKVERADGSTIRGTVEKNVGGTATVLVTDDGPALDEEVRILSEEGEELGSGTLYIHSVFRITGFSGTVSSVSAKENQQIYVNSPVCHLKDTAYSARYNSILKQRREKEDTLLELLGLYQGGALRAPFTGTVLKIDFDENDDTSSSTSTAQTSQGMDMFSMMYGMGTTQTATTTTETSADVEGTAVVTMAPDVSMKVTINVDESDILSLERGQAAEITIESVSDRTMSGTVTEVDRSAANSSSGVTTYAAEVTFAKTAGMLSGMTADVVVNIEGTENVLIVPADAIQKTAGGSFVYTAYDEEGKHFGGMTPVEVGISNDDFAEIRSGLEEGTVVYYTEKEQNDFFMMMGGPGMMGGNRRQGRR